MTLTEIPAVAHAVETVQSHLHPVPSYDLADHPIPTGREEVWRFTPLKRLRGLLDGVASDARLSWETTVPAGVTVSEISAAAAAELGEPRPADLPSALAVANASSAVLIDIAAEAELTEPLHIRLTGASADQTVWGHIIVRLGHHAKATVVFEHTGSAVYSANTSVLVGAEASLDLV